MAVGAILRFAVNVTTTGFNIHTIGVILMIAGAVAFVVSLAWIISDADRRSRYTRRTTTYVDPGAPGAPAPRDY